MENLIQDTLLAIVLSGLVAVAIETVKTRLKKANINLKGGIWFSLSILISVLVAYGFIVYYQQLPIEQAIMIYFIMVFGAQGFYTVILDKDKPTHEQTYNKLNEGE
jgi:uncharacterized membrane protein YfcA